MLDFILINESSDDLEEYSPYQNAEMCCYTCRKVPIPAWLNCRCSIHRNDREEYHRKKQYNKFTFDERRYKYAFGDSHLQTDKTNIKRSDSMEILQIEPPITELDLKKAYRKMSLKSHPDKSGGSNEQFIKVNEAYNELLPVCC